MVTNLPILYLQIKNVITYLAVIIFHFIFILKYREFHILYLKTSNVSGLNLQFLAIPTVNLQETGKSHLHELFRWHVIRKAI